MVGRRPENHKSLRRFDCDMFLTMELRFTDEELIALPASELTKGERVRRRRAKRRQRELAAKQTKAGEISKNARRGTCQGFNKKGEPCKSYALHGAKHCRAHLNDAEKAKLGMKSLTEAGTEARRLAPSIKGMTGPQAIRKVWEAAVEKLAYRYFLALGLDFQGFDQEGNAIVIDQGVEQGVRVYGESKDGEVVMSEHPDLLAQIQVMEKMMDRVWGRAKQTTMIEGNPNAPISVKPVRSVERSQDMAALLHRVGAIPRGTHEGRARSAPSEPATSPADTDSNVTPLRKE